MSSHPRDLQVSQYLVSVETSSLDASSVLYVFNDILHMSFLAGTHVFKSYPAYTTTETRVRTKCSSICSVSVELY